MLKLIPGNAQHIGARKEQQDSFGFSDTRDTALVAHGGIVAAVADGMGGLEGGQQSSSIAIEAFMAAYARKTPREPVPAALRRSLLEANRAVLAVARQTGTAGNTGTTFAAAAVHNDLLYWIATGDSRIYLLRNGQTVQVNADHTHGTTLWPAVAAGHLSRDSALNDPQAPHLTSHLGMEELAHIDLSERPFPLQADDVVTVCSDGIYRAVGERELAEAFRTAGSPSAACSAIQASVLAKGSAKQDNLTILAIECRDPNPAPVTVRPAVAAAAARPAAKGPSNLVLVSLFCAELLMAAGLGGSYVWGRWSGTPPQPANPVVITTQSVTKPVRPDKNGEDQPPVTAADTSENDNDLPDYANYKDCKKAPNPVWCRWGKFLKGLKKGQPVPTRLENGTGAGNNQADAPGTGPVRHEPDGVAPQNRTNLQPGAPVTVTRTTQSSDPAHRGNGASGGGEPPGGAVPKTGDAGPEGKTGPSTSGMPAPQGPPPDQIPRPPNAPGSGAPPPTKTVDPFKIHQHSDGDER